MENYQQGYQNMDPRANEMHHQIPNIKYEPNSQGLYNPYMMDHSKKIYNRPPKVSNSDIDALLKQNSNIINTLTKLSGATDPQFFRNCSTLQRNLVFLSRIADQPN
ncbi:hypothetical protein BEWA_027860 [Theileria equi strain WA]|uniref:Uncharacterized protein n=1 Tax=Theileria equi strain WA TaxID=1537102 RepID=L0AWH5_THEEQ|nr:hypothetical protein BEWA_027860 [Theileria equi strain WA]AFZ79937.1 hypothetical protein BEWA_027860 [Theileria equi strain WA]|eukprot:XP_004829603.1 hypothetical protein BEWA_027860 [Theileria equi strain WA]